MLNLETLSIASTAVPTDNQEVETIKPTYTKIEQPELQETPTPKKVEVSTEKVKPIKNPTPFDLVPKVVQLPNNWNLEKLKLDMQTKNMKNTIISPEDNLDSDWEII